MILTISISTIRIVKDYNSFQKALDKIKRKSDIETCWVIGGSSIYNEFITSNLCDKIYLTKIEENFECDTFFPEIDLKKYHETVDPVVSQDLQIEESDESLIKYRYHVYERN